MKKKTFVILFITVNLTLLFLYIHKQNAIIRLSFKKQRNEKLKEELAVQKEKLMQELHTLNNKATIKEYATKQLGMKTVELKQITVLYE